MSGASEQKRKHKNTHASTDGTFKSLGAEEADDIFSTLAEEFLEEETKKKLTSEKSTAVGALVSVAGAENLRVVSNSNRARANARATKELAMAERHGQIMQGQSDLSQQIRHSIADLQAQASANVQAVYNYIQRVNENIHTMSEDQRELARRLQANIVGLAADMATIQGNILLRLSELKTANESDVARLTGELKDLQAKQERNAKAIQDQLAEVEKGRAQDGKDMRKGLEQIQGQFATLQRELNAQAAAQGAADAETRRKYQAAMDAAAATAAQAEQGSAAAQAAAAAADAALDVKNIEIYTCSCCGGSVNSASCIANIDPLSRNHYGQQARISVMISQRQFQKLQASGIKYEASQEMTPGVIGTLRLIIPGTEGQYAHNMMEVFRHIGAI